MLRTLTAAAILALSITASHAETTEVSVDVSYGDLNLTHAGDAKILADRLQTAARSVCKSIGAEAEMSDCMHAAIRGALTRIEGKMEDNVLDSLGGS